MASGRFPLKFTRRACGVFSLCILILLIAAGSAPSIAQSQTVALTFDDLPAAGTKDPAEAESFNRAILDPLAMHRAPAIGFVNEKKVLELGSKEVLEQWVRRGFDLGNHSFSHADLNNLTDEQFEVEVIGRSLFLLSRSPRRTKLPAFCAFLTITRATQPRNMILSQRSSNSAAIGSRHAPSTTKIIYSTRPTFGCWQDKTTNPPKSCAPNIWPTRLLRSTTTRACTSTFGRAIPHVMLFHLNRLSADLMNQLLDIFEARNYRFVSLDTAQSDAAYDTPDTFTTSYGPMWGYRWAKERGVKVDGSLELEPAESIAQYVTAAKK
jgi:hypothetical protein